MKIHFGLHLDGLQPAAPVTAMGEVTLGPAGFIDVLETQLGIPPVITRPAEAVLAYRGCLAAVNNPRRFYHRSFAVDPMSVARTLLGWRASWYEAGWNGDFPGTASQRLADMAEVERQARDTVPLCRGQRLQRIASALTQLRTQVERVVLHDDPEELPATWRAVLEHFHVDIAPGVAAQPRASPGTDLHRVQSRLLSIADAEHGVSPRPERLNGDHSFLIVRAVSRDLSAQAVGEYLLKHGALDETVVIAEKDGIILDNALERVGLARGGFRHHSPFRAVTQVLKLCLALLWEPVNPRLLLQLLIHPVGPLPRHARTTLAEAVAAEPGVGGKAWREALDTIANRQREQFGETEKAIGALGREIGAWFQGQRYSPTAGAPVDIVMGQAQRCAAWLTGRLHALAPGDEQELFAAAFGQAEALTEALRGLKDQGHATVKKIELERLIDEVTADSPDPGTFAEAGHVRATTQPAAITQPWHTVIWWDLSLQPFNATYPWSQAELAELTAHGVALPPMDERLRARTRQWLRPILNARTRLLLVVHDREEAHHVLWNQLTSQFQGWQEVRPEDALIGGHLTEIPALEIPSQALACRPLPKPKRWWRLPRDCRLGPRATESYSSLQKVLYYPHQWVLHYPARLRTGRAADIPSGPLLYGNLAHQLFASFFEAHPDWAALDNQTVKAWLSDRLPSLLNEEGAVLFEAGAGVSRQRVLHILEGALQRLLHHLRRANIDRVRAEHWMEAPFDSIRLCGGIDLLLTDKQGRDIVLDVKWGSEDRRGAELETNSHVQLATYAYLRRAERGGERWAYPAFFILSTGNVLAQDTSVFPDAVEFPAISGEGIEQLWQRVRRTLDWRWAQLSNGDVEVNVNGTEPGAEAIPPEEGLDVRVEPDDYDDFSWLTGWEDGA